MHYRLHNLLDSALKNMLEHNTQFVVIFINSLFGIIKSTLTLV